MPQQPNITAAEHRRASRGSRRCVVDGEEEAAAVDGASAATQRRFCGVVVGLQSCCHVEHPVWRDYSAKRPSSQQNQIRLQQPPRPYRRCSYIPFLPVSSSRPHRCSDSSGGAPSALVHSGPATRPRPSSIRGPAPSTLTRRPTTAWGGSGKQHGSSAPCRPAHRPSRRAPTTPQVDISSAQGMTMILLARSLRSSLRPPLAAGFSSAPTAASSSAAAAEAERSIRDGPRNDWSRPEIQAVYDSPLLDLLFHGAQVHRNVHKFREVQQCTLLSIKTGGCSEDCSYCPQSSRYNTGLKAQKLMNKDDVLEAAKKAKEAGSTRFCMGAAWRETIGRKTNFNQILGYVKEIRGMGMEVCCTLGMIEKQQAEELKKAGLTAYNHNLDTSREYYPNIITTRSYDDRLQTLQHVREAGISICSGGIIGLGEAEEDRVGLLHTLATLPTHPESVPINALVAVKGTPLEDQKPVEIWEMIRMVATARIVMPKAMVRLSAGRVRFSMPEQALCFLAGANSIFAGEKLLTTANNDFDADKAMFKILGLIPKAPSFSDEEAAAPDSDTERPEQAASM
uniref:biotin synthase n=3 Tax=Setaria TaxID=4554 RepID=K3XG33_SETIT